MPTLTLFPGTSREATHHWRGDQFTIGRAPSNDLSLDDSAVSVNHARIERRGDEFWLVDLQSTNGTFLNGVRIRETPLKNADKIFFGEVIPVRFEFRAEELKPQPPPPIEPEVTVIPTTPIPVTSSLQTVNQPSAVVPAGVQCPACQAMIPFTVNFCPRCGFNLSQGGMPAFPAASPMGPGYVRPQEAAGSSVGMLPLIALLCGISVIGFPFAIILGLVALAQIRRSGGFSADRKQAIAGVLLGVLWLMVLGGVAGWYGSRTYREAQLESRRVAAAEREKVIANNEAAVIDQLKGVACAQKLAKLLRVKDPNQTGTGQYLELADFGKVGIGFFSPDILRGQSNGYRFRILRSTTDNYLALAEPDPYNEMGRRTFTVDASGVVRGQDLAGHSYEQANQPLLPALSELKSAFTGMDDAIAKEAVAYARNLANEGRLEECNKILADITEQFAMTSSAEELQSLKKNVEPFIVESQATARYKKALAAADTGDLKLAIAQLKDITELYPTYSRITTVAEDLNRFQTQLAQRLDAEAKDLFDKAEAAEREGNPTTALELYVQIEKNYPDTEWGKRIGQLRPALQNSIREKSAEQLYAQIRNLSVTENHRDIVNTLEQLMRNYTDTAYVRDNSATIVAFYQKALAQQYRALAIEQMQAVRDGEALQRLEEACTANADLRPALKDIFLKLYLRVGQKRMDEGDERDALDLYRKYLALQPEQSEVSPALLARLNYAVAKSEFATGNYTNAANSLIAARATYDKDPEYNDLCGSVLIALGRYTDAIAYFDRAILAKPNTGNYHARRGYAQLLDALTIEQEALTAFAGFMNAAAPVGTNEPPAAVPAPAGTGHVPAFATQLPATPTGLRPEVQIKYDALASQNLLDEVLDLLQYIQEAGNGAAISRPTRRAAPTGPSPDPTSTREVNIKARINRIRTGVELGNAVSAIHQKILDDNSRKTKASAALRRMSTLMAYANRDLATAISLNADDAAQLTEILRATRLHESKLATATGKMTNYLSIEMETLQRAYEITEHLYRNLRVQHLSSATDPTLPLETYFTKLFDRRDFDQGIQRLREAASIQVPLDTYPILPKTSASRPVPTPSPATTE
jgi:tetratricopeptide (TPR) repeat protein